MTMFVTLLRTETQHGVDEVCIYQVSTEDTSRGDKGTRLRDRAGASRGGTPQRDARCNSPNHSEFNMNRINVFQLLTYNVIVTTAIATLQELVVG